MGDAMNDDDAKRHAYLDQLRRILPRSPAWESWLDTSGELPPDFDALPSRYYPHYAPDDMTDQAAWQARREAISDALQHWILGSVPPAPDNLRIEVLNERRENGAITREVELRFGAGYASCLWLELLIPDGEGPFPVFVTQHNHRNWAQVALSRGYMACVYAGADTRDDTDTFTAGFPGYEWSRITRRAWAASRCLDYLEGEPLADSKKVAITGHSRNGKLSLIAAALDERFSVVISSSSGAGGSMSARFVSEQHFGEGIEFITRRFPDWFHPRWRFFVGREHKLPVDLTDLIALIAPRPCLLSSAVNDHVCSVWAVEQTVQAVRPVYHAYGAGDNLRLLWRQGSHETWPEIIERYIDWCDLHFGRGDYNFPQQPIYPHDWQAWQRRSGAAAAAVPEQRDPLAQRIQAMLGSAPPAVKTDFSIPNYPAGSHVAALLHQNSAPDVEKQTLDFGEHISGDVYYPKGLAQSGQRFPAVLWLHPWSPPKGYVAGYLRGDPLHHTLARAGFVVFCFDQIGFGQRIEEVQHFYTRHPRWSLLGKMVRDAQAALDALLSLAYVDVSCVYALGYSTGSLVGLHLAALEERLTGFAGVCIPPALRLDVDDSETGGLRRWSHLTMLWPQVGLYEHDPARLPYDIGDLIAAIAPRPALIVSPQLDREAPLALVSASVDEARAVYQQRGAAGQLTQLSPETYNHFDPDMQALVIEWLKRQKA